MAEREPKNLRNVTLVGHDGVGKSALIEALLYNTGTVDTFRRITGGPSIIDQEPEEVKRNLTLLSQIYRIKSDGTEYTFLDTPGNANFIVDVRNCINASEATIFMIDAEEGIKVPAPKFWDLRSQSRQPTLIFVNSVDAEKAQPAEMLEQAQERLDFRGIPIQLPIGKGADFCGVVDLVEQKAYRYPKPYEGKCKAEEIPAEMADEVAAAREQMLESVIEMDDAIMEKYLEGEPVTDEQIRGCLKKGFQSGDLIPVIYGSAVQNIGLVQLLDCVKQIVPNPLERDPYKAKDGDAEIEIQPTADGAMLGVIFKTTEDQFQGRINYVRVIRGHLGSDVSIHKPGEPGKEKMPTLGIPIGKEVKKCDHAIAGDIVAMIKAKHLSTCDTIAGDDSGAVLQGYSIPSPIIGFAVTPKDSKLEEKVYAGINKLCDEDPTLRLTQNKSTHETVWEGMGQLHIDVASERLTRRFGVEVELNIPKVPYRETLKKKATVQGKFKKQSGGRGQYGDCHLRIEPLPRGGGFEFVNEVVGGVIPKNYIPAVEKGVVASMERGVLAGFPIVDIKVTVFDGSYHDVDSSDNAFQRAGSIGLRKGAEEAGILLLEPIMLVEVTTPDDYLGAVNGDLNGRRGRILGMDPLGKGLQMIRAKVPLAELPTYAPELRAMTQGAAIFTMALDSWEEVPAHLSEKVVEERKHKHEEED